MPPATLPPRRWALWAEFVALYLGVPLICWRVRLPVIPVLIVVAVVIRLRMATDKSFPLKALSLSKPPRCGIRPILTRWLISLPLLAGLVYIIRSAALFELPIHRPIFWLILMIAYPLISVWPQELVFRAYFCHRYQPILGSQFRLRLANAALFGLAHISFGNGIAVGLSAIGGWLFCGTYLRTKSLAAAAFEHSLYGCAIFTIGLGQFFFNAGTMKLLESAASRVH